MNAPVLPSQSAILLAERAPKTVAHFDALDGLRAWLAWGVFFGHVILFAGLGRLRLPAGVDAITTVCVEIFMVVSGFVIAHLLLTKPEPYLPYIVKRFFRLFPALIVCTAIGAATIAMSRTPWPFDPGYQYGQQLAGLQDAQRQNFLLHSVLHFMMVHGMIPNTVLPLSQWALLPPAWSVSLEWQFYLVAPVVLLLFRKPAGAVSVLVITIAGLLLYARGAFGAFESPSLLPGAAEFFLLGIGSRLWRDRLNPTAPAFWAIVALGLAFLTKQPAIGIWIAFLTYLFCQRNRAGSASRRYVLGADALFTSRPAQWAGKRTYCVYLVHFPVFQLVLTMLALADVRSPTQVATLLVIFGLPLTVGAAEVLHRYVEVPGIRFGKDAAHRVGLVRRLSSPTSIVA